MIDTDARLESEIRRLEGLGLDRAYAARIYREAELDPQADPIQDLQTIADTLEIAWRTSRT